MKNSKGRIWLFILLFVLLAAVLTAGVILGVRYLRGSNGTTSEESSSERVKEEEEEPIEADETEGSEPLITEEEAVEWSEPGLVLLGECEGYPEKDAFEVELTVLVSSTVEPDTLEILLGGETVLASVRPAEFPESWEDGDFSLSVSVTVPEAEEGVTAECITARMGDAVSDDLILCREVTVTEEMEERLCLILDESSEEIDKMLDAMEDETDLSDIAERIMQMLQARPDVEDAWLAGDGLIRFTTVDHLASNIWLREVSDDPEKNTLGASARTAASWAGTQSMSGYSDGMGTEELSGQIVSGLSGLTTDPKELEKYLDYMHDYRASIMDPDVLVLSPVYLSDPAFHLVDILDPIEGGPEGTLYQIGQIIADEYGGRCDLVDDQLNRRTPLEFLLTHDLTEYGTIMIQTHGMLEKMYVSEILELLMYRSRSEDRAEDFWNDARKISRLSPRDFVDHRYMKSHTQLMSAKLLFGLYYDISFIGIKPDSTKYFGICVTSNYFKLRYNNSYFPGSLVLLDACESMKNPSIIGGFLVDRGCSCVLGFKSEVLMPVADAAVHAVFWDGLLYEQDGYEQSGGARFSTLYEAETNDHFPGRVTWTHYTGWDGFVYEGCGWLSGELRYDDMTPVVDGQVFAWRLWNGSLQREAAVRTDSEGRYAFARLPWGVYLLQAFDGEQETFWTIYFATVEKSGVDFYFAALPGEDESRPDDETSEAVSSDDFSGPWIGIWESESGESIEITEQHEDYILMTYHGYTAAGGMFTSYYTLYFDDESHLSAAEEDAVLEAAGWRYRLVLEEDRIVMESRYPDRYFYRSGE